MNATNESLNRTALYENHLKLGAKMVPFTGFEMPVSYAGLTEEHHSVRNACGIFDVSHMGEFRVKGPEALHLIQWITSNDAAVLVPGQVQYSCMPNGRGGIVDDLLVYCISNDEYMLVVNASNRIKDWEWIASQNRWDALVEDESDDWSLIAIQGPEAASLLQPFCDLSSLEQMKYYTFAEGNTFGHSTLVSATGYTGAGGFELYVRNNAAAAVWEGLIRAGAPPCGLGARDTLRLEAGFCLYGNDIDETTSPIEAGLGWITKFTNDFVDRDLLELQKKDGTALIFRGFKMLERGIPRQGYPIENSAGETIGRITSGTQSPTLGVGISMGYIQRESGALGEQVAIRIRKNTVPAIIVRPGFLPKK
jgi:aminomethyltransferase